MHWLEQMIHWHPVTVGVVAMWLFSNLVATMPTPDEKAGPWYKWAFGLLHTLGAGLPRLVAALAPQYAKFVGAGAVLDTKAETPNPEGKP